MNAVPLLTSSRYDIIVKTFKEANLQKKMKNLPEERATIMDLDHVVGYFSPKVEIIFHKCCLWQISCLSPTTIFFIISPSSLSHSQILTPRVRLPSSKLPNSLNWKISKCWNLQFQNSTISIFNIWTFKIFASGIFPTALIETLENIWTFLNLWELQYQLEYFQTFLNLWKLRFQLVQFQLLRSTI